MSRPNIYFTVGAYVSMYIVIDLLPTYFSSAINKDKYNILREIMDDSNAPKIINRRKDMKFADRDSMNKVFRVIFKMSRAIFVSVIYYFIPFALFYVSMYYNWIITHQSIQ